MVPLGKCSSRLCGCRDGQTRCGPQSTNSPPRCVEGDRGLCYGAIRVASVHLGTITTVQELCCVRGEISEKCRKVVSSRPLPQRSSHRHFSPHQVDDVQQRGMGPYGRNVRPFLVRNPPRLTHRRRVLLHVLHASATRTHMRAHTHT